MSTLYEDIIESDHDDVRIEENLPETFQKIYNSFDFKDPLKEEFLKMVVKYSIMEARLREVDRISRDLSNALGD